MSLLLIPRPCDIVTVETDPEKVYTYFHNQLVSKMQNPTYLNSRRYDISGVMHYGIEIVEAPHVTLTGDVMRRLLDAVEEADWTGATIEYWDKKASYIYLPIPQ